MNTFYIGAQGTNAGSGTAGSPKRFRGPTEFTDTVNALPPDTTIILQADQWTHGLILKAGQRLVGNNATLTLVPPVSDGLEAILTSLRQDDVTVCDVVLDCNFESVVCEKQSAFGISSVGGSNRTFERVTIGNWGPAPGRESFPFWFGNLAGMPVALNNWARFCRLKAPAIEACNSGFQLVGQTGYSTEVGPGWVVGGGLIDCVVDPVVVSPPTPEGVGGAMHCFSIGGCDGTVLRGCQALGAGPGSGGCGVYVEGDSSLRLTIDACQFIGIATGIYFNSTPASGTIDTHKRHTILTRNLIIVDPRSGGIGIDFGTNGADNSDFQFVEISSNTIVSGGLDECAGNTGIRLKNVRCANVRDNVVNGFIRPLKFSPPKPARMIESGNCDWDGSVLGFRND